MSQARIYTDTEVSVYPFGKILLHGEIVKTGVSYTAITPNGED